MKRIPLTLLIILTLLTPLIAHAQSDDPSPPAEPVKLIFIHHSTGENWLADGYGNLGITLGENNYFVSDTNYGWGPNGIGDATDIPNWIDWFASEETPTYMNALFNENGQHSSYTRALSDPGGENEIIMFKSCFPNSDLYGNPNDPPGDYEDMTVAGAKYVYNTILEYFATRPDKLFIAITAPPLSDDTNAANARAFNNWLVNDWLADYEGTNVAVFDFYDVLTGPNGGDTLYYPSDDDHPSEEGSQLATVEFLPVLNIAYNRWQAGDTSALPVDSEPAPVSDVADAEAESQPESSAASPSLASGLIDNFEGGAPANTYGWEAYTDEEESENMIACTLSKEVVYSGEQSLKIDYHIVLYSWATCDLTYENLQNLSNSAGISFYVYAAQENTFFNVDLFLENEDYVYEVALDTHEEWVRIDIPWADFKRVEWEENGGSPFSKPEQISGLAFGFGTPDNTEKAPSGTIWIDDLQTLGDSPVGEEAPAVDEEPAPGVESSTGEDAASDEGGSSICPGSMALGAMTMVLAGIVISRRRETC